MYLFLLHTFYVVDYVELHMQRKQIGQDRLKQAGLDMRYSETRQVISPPHLRTVQTVQRQIIGMPGIVLTISTDSDLGTS